MIINVGIMVVVFIKVLEYLNATQNIIVSSHIRARSGLNEQDDFYNFKDNEILPYIIVKDAKTNTIL